MRDLLTQILAFTHWAFPFWGFATVFRCVSLFFASFTTRELWLPKEMAWHLKGKVAKCDHREYGFAQIRMNEVEGDGRSSVDTLFEGLGNEMQV